MYSFLSGFVTLSIYCSYQLVFTYLLDHFFYDITLKFCSIVSYIYLGLYIHFIIIFFINIYLIINTKFKISTCRFLHYYVVSCMSCTL